jgi:hypothetical protein
MGEVTQLHLSCSTALRERLRLRGFSASRQGQPAGRSFGGGLRFAATALRCSVRGRVAELTALTSFAAFKQPRRVSSRSTRCARADPGPALLVATEIARAEQHLPRSPPSLVFVANTTALAAKARAGRLRRACEAPRSTGLVAARTARIHN